MDIFSKGNDTIIYADVISALRDQIPDHSIDLIFADPPYNIGKVFNGRKEKWRDDNHYIEWCYQWLDQCIAKLAPTGSMYLMAATQYMPYIDIYIRDKLSIMSRIIWHYDSSGAQAQKFFGSLYEPILFGVVNPKKYTFNASDILVPARTGATRKLIDYRKPQPTVYSNEKVPGNAWYYPRVRYRMQEYENHPTQKPEALLERIILASSNEGDTVLDPFSGTFTTAAVAQRLGRKTIGIELEEEYVKIGLRRLGIAAKYKGEVLRRKPRFWEEPIPNGQELRGLFEDSHGE